MDLIQNRDIKLVVVVVGLNFIFVRGLSAEDVFSCKQKQDCGLQLNPCTHQFIAINQHYNYKAFREDTGCRDVKGASGVVGIEAGCISGRCTIQELSPKNYPPEYQEATLWLQSLAIPKPTLHGPIGAPKWNIELLSNAISNAGLVLTNVNNEDENPKVLSHQDVLSQLQGHKDPLSGVIAHVSEIYSQNVPQYSSLFFEPKGNELDIKMSTLYRFHYVQESGHYKLREIHYLLTEGE